MDEQCKSCRSFSSVQGMKTGWCMKHRKPVKKADVCGDWSEDGERVYVRVAGEQ